MDFAISKVADAGLSSLFQAMFDTLTPSFLQSLGFLFVGVEGEAKKLEKTLSRIQAHLNDAEARQIREESVRLWLRELKDAAYDAEDIVDEVDYQVLLRSKIEGAQMQTRKRKLTDPVFDFVSSSSSNLNLGPRIKEIRERLEEIERRSNHLHLKAMLESERLVPGKRHPTSSIIDASIVFGREADREKVVGLLTSDGDSSAANSGIQIVPICGMGGLGKTTLAQLAYKDERVVKHFEVKVWVYVSEDFDLMRLTKAIAESVPGSNPHLINLDAIQVSIMEALKEKRFLLVLDDVWTEDFDDWHKLMFGARGSRILVTTRSRKVSSNMGTVTTHFLQGLSYDDCWSLFKRRAFVDGDSDANPDLVKIGKEIVKKCNGLPLAVKTLGGLLCSVVNVVQWKKILKSEIWDLPEERNDILPALRLSYHHLPAHLKRCFAYCACLINKGSRGCGRQWNNSEVDGTRSLLNCKERGERLCYTMHDLTHDLARSVLGADFWKIGDEKSHGNNAEKARYMSHVRITSCNFDDFYCLENLRTLSLFCTENIPAALFIKLRHIRTLHLHESPITELPESIGDLLQLRYLDLSRTVIEMLSESTTRLYNLQTLILESCEKLVEVPESIGDLLQLRYLDLSRTVIERLPESTTRLYNLQTLILKGCRKLVEVPESIGDLLQLHYLDLSCTKIERLPESTTRLYNLQTLNLSGCRRLVELPSDLSNLVNLRHLHHNSSSVSTPPRIGTLKGLQTLSHFIVGKEIGRRINELKDLIHLRGFLCISKLENVVNVEEAKEAYLKNKQKIDRLKLQWKCHSVESRQEGIEEEVLNALQPHTNLKRLQIKGYCGVRFPTWLGDSSFSKLIRVTLRKCRCRLLPPFGRLPSLQYLTLEDLHVLKKVGREFYGDGTMTGFPPLESLSVYSMPDLEELSGLESDIRHIREIVISNCTKLSLSSLRYLTSLSRLEILNCSNITSLGNGLQHLTSLQSLEIAYCPELTSLTDVDLPATLDDGLGNSNYSNPTCLPKGLQNLTIFGCPKIHSLPEELSTTLSYLRISDFATMTSLPNGLQHLTSLQSLEIFDCPELTSLTDVDLPATLDDGFGNSNYSNPTCLPKGLQNLTLGDCPKISSLPEELLTTLRYLYIDKCSLLEEKYLVLAEGDNGYRCKISDIPDITFEGDCADRSLFPLPRSLSPSVFLALSLNLPASAAIITSSCYNHRKQPLPLLSSPLLFTAGSRVTGLVAKKLEWRNDDSMGLNYTKIPMDAIAVDEAIWHGMKISEVDETRITFRCSGFTHNDASVSSPRSNDLGYYQLSGLKNMGWIDLYGFYLATFIIAMHPGESSAGDDAQATYYSLQNEQQKNSEHTYVWHPMPKDLTMTIPRRNDQFKSNQLGSDYHGDLMKMTQLGGKVSHQKDPFPSSL
ncbi:putative disease resistance protein RGA1 [Cinnamomum micranthum f. kanehirae]|uniref:Putative disease resistance protein RGA1 n=1 Tax=Cinnamomum micranthum f. kanehirae TaxID=337451 RepID=A0A443PM59_9MAGN|nr:putative disease resistance protein RGA1 [Cinnamomum micranthum f. kanehirae]